MRTMKRVAAFLLAITIATVLLSGCDRRVDTRKYVNTIGVVIKNDIDVVFDELYVYPANSDEMGPDFIRNSWIATKIGSYGVTVEDSERYNVWVRDRWGAVFVFEVVSFQNGDFAEISFQDELVLTVYHMRGGSETVIGVIVEPGDAPDHPFNQSIKMVPFQFTLENRTDKVISFVSMREASALDKGEVELSLENLEAGKTETINRKLEEEDVNITDWILNIVTADGKEYAMTEPFNPWKAKAIVVSLDGEKFMCEVTYN